MEIQIRFDARNHSGYLVCFVHVRMQVPPVHGKLRVVHCVFYLFVLLVVPILLIQCIFVRLLVEYSLHFSVLVMLLHLY